MLTYQRVVLSSSCCCYPRNWRCDAAWPLRHWQRPTRPFVVPNGRVQRRGSGVVRHGQNPWENRGKSMVNMDFNGIMILGNAVETPSFLAKVTGEISIAIFDYQNIIPETRMGMGKEPRKWFCYIHFHGCFKEAAWGCPTFCERTVSKLSMCWSKSIPPGPQVSYHTWETSLRRLVVPWICRESSQ